MHRTPTDLLAGVDPVLVEIGPVRLWWYGLAYAVGLLSVDLWVYLKRERLGFTGREVGEFSLLFGAVGVYWYVGHLAWEIFEDSMLLPFVLSAASLAIIALGILYARNEERIERAVVGIVPKGLRRMLPQVRSTR